MGCWAWLKTQPSGLAFSVKTPRATPSVTPKASPSGLVFSQAQHPMIKIHILACITARASRTCRDAWRDRQPMVAGKTHAQHMHNPQICVSGTRPIGWYSTWHSAVAYKFYRIDSSPWFPWKYVVYFDGMCWVWYPHFATDTLKRVHTVSWKISWKMQYNAYMIWM